MSIGLYRVVGRRRYRGHEPGEEFVAELEPRAEVRAITRGDIELLERVVPALEAGSWELPEGWAKPRRKPHEQKEG
jgi:hypothetical protein